MKDSFIINDVKFNMITSDDRLYEEQRIEADKFVVRDELRYSDEVNIKYTKDRKFFNRLVEEFRKSSDIEKIDTFKGECHYKFNNGKVDVFAKDNGEYFAFIINDTDIVIVGNPDVDTHEFPFRVVREVLVRKMEDQQYVFTHATGIKVNGKGYCIIANSGGGKTTLMSKMLEKTRDSKVLSNDRLFIKNVNGKLVMRAFPIPIVYAMGTVKGSPKLSERFRGYRLTNRKWGLELDHIENGKKMEFNLTDIERVFDCTLSTKEQIDVIIIPKINKDLGENVEARLMSKYEAIGTLQNNSFTPYDTESERAPWIYERLTSLDMLEENKHSVIMQELKTPILYVEYGLDAKPEMVMKTIEETAKVYKNEQFQGE